MYIGIHIKHILMQLVFSGQFLKKIQKLNFMKIRPLETELFHSNVQTGGRTNMTKLTVVFSHFCEST